MPAFGSGKMDRLLVKHLGIEKEAIHIEHDGGWHARELHGSPV